MDSLAPFFPLLSLATTIIASIIGWAVRQALGGVTTSVGALSKQLDGVSDKVDALEKDRMAHAVTQSRLSAMELEVRSSREKIDQLRTELERRTLREVSA